MLHFRNTFISRKRSKCSNRWCSRVSLINFYEPFPTTSSYTRCASFWNITFHWFFGCFRRWLKRHASEIFAEIVWCFKIKLNFNLSDFYKKMIKFNPSLNRSNKNSPRDNKIDYFVFDSKHRLIEFIIAVGFIEPWNCNCSRIEINFIFLLHF